ncbi:MAG: porin family protein [Bacteroidota bacterium]
MIKKSLLTLILPILFISHSNAQDNVDNLPNFDEQSWHWGYYLGVNHYDFKITPTDLGMTNNDQLGIISDATIGFSVGLLGDFKVNDYLNFRVEPGLSYTTRNLTYHDDVMVNFEGTYERTDTIREIHSTYVNIPLLLKFGGKRMKNIRPYLIGGANLGIDLNSHQNGADDNTTGYEGFRTKTMNLFWEAGGGIDWYLPYFKFTTEVRGSFGIKDELVRDGNPPGTLFTPWTGSIDKLQTRAIFFVLKFE